jgi:hypothetical protein
MCPRHHGRNGHNPHLCVRACWIQFCKYRFGATSG